LVAVEPGPVFATVLGSPVSWTISSGRFRWVGRCAVRPLPNLPLCLRRARLRALLRRSFLWACPWRRSQTGM